MDNILVIIYLALSWKFLSDFQDNAGISFFGSLKYYFFLKLTLCAFFGWVIIPLGIIIKILKIIAK